MNRWLIVFASLVLLSSIAAAANYSFDLNIICTGTGLNCRNVDLASGDDATFDINFINTGDDILDTSPPYLFEYDIYFPNNAPSNNLGHCISPAGIPMLNWSPLTKGEGVLMRDIGFAAGCVSIPNGLMASTGGGTIQIVGKLKDPTGTVLAKNTAFQTATIKRAATNIPDNSPIAAIVFAFLVLAIAFRSNRK